MRNIFEITKFASPFTTRLLTGGMFDLHTPKKILLSVQGYLF